MVRRLGVRTKQVMESEKSDYKRNPKKNRTKAGTMLSVELHQKTALPGTAHILRMVLESS